LGYAASIGYEPIITLLLQNKAQVNQKISNGYYKGKTPLHFACEKKNDRATELLVDFGADYTIKNKEGKSCMDIAKGRCLEILQKNKKSKGSVITVSKERDQEKIPVKVPEKIFDTEKISDEVQQDQTKRPTALELLTKLETIKITPPSSRDPFRLNLVAISMKLTKNEWRHMVAMYNIPESLKENFDQAMDFFDYLLKIYPRSSVISELQQLFKENGREDLLEILSRVTE